jgi:hypothetical protein
MCFKFDTCNTILLKHGILFTKISQVGKGWSDAASRVCIQISIPSLANVVNLAHELITHCLFTKISQAEKVSQVQHLENPLKSASLVEPVVLS